MQNGNIFVITAPSGAGKSSLVNALCNKDKTLQLSVSHTTRPIRTGEVDGVNYYFIKESTFKNMINNHEFIEYAIVYGNYYGTNINTVQKFVQTGKDIILEIDWQGAQQIKKIFPDAILIFILPPSLDVLRQRLENRNTDDETVIKKRLDEAKNDISHAKDFEYIIINDKFDDALDDLYSIIHSFRLKSKKVLKQIKFLSNN